MDALAVLVQRQQHLRALPEDLFGDAARLHHVPRTHLLRALDLQGQVEDHAGQVPLLEAVEERKVEQRQVGQHRHPFSQS